MSSNSVQHLRLKGHTEGIGFMKDDNFLLALQTLKETHTSYQGHILLLIDLASCYYMLNDHHSFQKWTLKSLEEFNLGYDSFSSTTQSRAVLGLGKLLEEIGYVDEALALYRKKIKEEIEVKDRTEHHSSFFRIEAQCLRLTAELKLLAEIPKAYVRCEQYKVNDSDIEYEIQSALMLCDFHMTGIESAFRRLLRIQRNSRYNESEKRLAFFNLLFELLLENRIEFEIDEVFFDSFPYFNCDVFEQSLLDLWSSEHAKTPLQILDVNRSELLSFMNGIRYLSLLVARPRLDQSREAKKKIIMFLKTISPSSRKLILQQWSIENQSEKVEIEISKNRIVHQGKPIPCSAATFNLLSICSENGGLPVDECIRRLFGLGLSDSTYSRLRMSVSRTNESLASHFGKTKVIRLTRNYLSIHDDIQVRVISDFVEKIGTK